MSEGQIAELVEDHEVEARQIIRDSSLTTVTRLSLEPVDEIDYVEEATPGAAADTGPGDRDGEVALAGPRATNQHGIALLGQEGADCVPSPRYLA